MISPFRCVGSFYVLPSKSARVKHFLLKFGAAMVVNWAHNVKTLLLSVQNEI